MLKDIVPTLETLYSQEGDPDPPNSDLSPKARRERLKATLDRQARLERALPRDSDAEKRRLFASVVAEMVARVRKAYARLNFPSPATLPIWVDPGFDEPTYVPAWGGSTSGSSPWTTAPRRWPSTSPTRSLRLPARGRSQQLDEVQALLPPKPAEYAAGRMAGPIWATRSSGRRAS
jgi:hypothetical protein